VLRVRKQREFIVHGGADIKRSNSGQPKDDYARRLRKGGCFRIQRRALALWRANGHALEVVRHSAPCHTVFLIVQQ
jgi:hypothetical protein